MSDTLLEHLARAEEHLKRANLSWNAADPEACAECAAHVERAMAEVRAASRAAAASTDPRGTKARLQLLRRNVEALTRMMDGSMSFYRGLALHSGMDA